MGGGVVVEVERVDGRQDSVGRPGHDSERDTDWVEVTLRRMRSSSASLLRLLGRQQQRNGEVVGVLRRPFESIFRNSSALAAHFTDTAGCLSVLWQLLQLKVAGRKADYIYYWVHSGTLHLQHRVSLFAETQMSSSTTGIRLGGGEIQYTYWILYLKELEGWSAINVVSSHVDSDYIWRSRRRRGRRADEQ